MFQFLNPQYLYLLLLIPLFLLLYVAGCLLARRKMGRLGTRSMLESLMPERSPMMNHVRFALLMLIAALLIIMLARPQYGLRKQKDTTKGIEAVVMVDVSNSMLARDASPSRLDRAKLLVSNLVDRMRNDKVALGVFAGEAYPQLPITSDYSSAKVFIEAISTQMVTLQGTNLAAAINLGCASFTDTKDVGKAIILITDGEDHEEGAEEAAAEAAKAGINVFVLGVGSTAGAEISTSQGALLDENGQPVHSALNEQMCRAVAAAGKGLYLHLDQSNSAQEELQAQLSRLKQNSVTTQYAARNEQFQAVGIFVLILLVIEALWGERKLNTLRRLKLFKQ